MKKSNAETMQLTSLSKLHFLGKVLPLKRIYLVKSLNRQRLDTTWKYPAPSQRWGGNFSIHKARKCQGIILREAGFAKDINCFSDTRRDKFLLSGMGIHTGGYFVNITCSAWKTAFMKAYQSLVNSVMFSLKNRTALSAGLMQSQYVIGTRNLGCRWEGSQLQCCIPKKAGLSEAGHWPIWIQRCN